MSNYDLMSHPQRTTAFQNVSKAPLIIGSIAYLKCAPSVRYAVVDIDETWKGTELTLMASNGNTVATGYKNVSSLLTPDGRFLKRS